MSALIDLDGNSEGAQRAIEELRQTVDRLGDELQQVTRQAQRTDRALEGTVDRFGRSIGGQLATMTRFGAAVFGFGAAAESVRRAFELARRSVQAYGEQSADAAQLIEGTSHRFSELAAAIGRAIVGGERAEETFGALQAVAQELTVAVGDNEEAIGNMVRSGIALMIDALAASIRVGVVFANTLDGIKFAITAAAMGVTQFGLAVVDGVLLTVEAATTAIRDLLQGLESVIETSARVARGLGRDGLADQLDGVLSRIDGMSAGVGRFRADIQRMRESIDDTSQAISDGLSRDLEDLTARTAQREEMNRLAETLSDLAEQYRTGAISAEAYRRAVDGATGAADREASKAAARQAAFLAGTEKQAQAIRDQIAKQEQVQAALSETAQQQVDQELAKRMERERRALAAAEQQRQANEALAASYYDLGAAVGDGTDSITQATIKAATDQLRALILRYIGEAAALGAVGRIGASVALGAAVGVMQRSLSQLGGGGSASAAGAAGAVSTTRTVQNISVSVAQTNGLGAGVDSTRAIGAAVEDGIRRGLINLEGRR